METRELTCIGCPLGCQLTASVHGDDISVSGNTCPRGADYARKEILNPARIVTSCVDISGGRISRLSVKTASDIPKEKIFKVMEEIRNTRVKAPVHTGDIIIKNAAGCGVDIIATKTIEAEGRGQA